LVQSSGFIPKGVKWPQRVLWHSMALEKQNHGHKTPIPHKKRGGGSQAEVSEEACFGMCSKGLRSLKATG
jgi:hypothetical protein